MDQWSEHLHELKEAIKRAERNTVELRNLANQMDAALTKRKTVEGNYTSGKKLTPRR